MVLTSMVADEGVDELEACLGVSTAKKATCVRAAGGDQAKMTCLKDKRQRDGACSAQHMDRCLGVSTAKLVTCFDAAGGDDQAMTTCLKDSWQRDDACSTEPA